MSNFKIITLNISRIVIYVYIFYVYILWYVFKLQERICFLIRNKNMFSLVPTPQQLKAKQVNYSTQRVLFLLFVQSRFIVIKCHKPLSYYNYKKGKKAFFQKPKVEANHIFPCVSSDHFLLILVSRRKTAEKKALISCQQCLFCSGAVSFVKTESIIVERTLN